MVTFFASFVASSTAYDQASAPIRRAVSAIAFGIAIAVGMAPSIARADDKNNCASASEKAQDLRRSGKLVEAREKLLLCSQTVCPAVVKQDCDQWLTSLDASMPTIVISARDPDGKDAADVRVVVDGTPLTTRLNGLGLPLNPGVHAFRFELDGAKPIEQQLVVHEAEHARPLAIVFEPLVARPPRAVATDPGLSSPRAESAEKHGPSPITYVLGTLGAVALGSFAFFEIKAATDAGHLRSTCAPRCAQSNVDDVSTATVDANVSLVSAAVLLGAAAVVFFTTRDSPHATTSLRFAPRAASLGATF